ncbi:MAG: DUF2470 domain-containing protein [Marivibrio sp.]|uniref:HugZ family pyridoxamine 5'-phosphate oxidase n=1 Tax=Marivibrio sp. TaxID=2039719 RepID=UPI0032EC2ED1
MTRGADDPAEAVRTLARTVDRAALSTQTADGGAPYVSLVLTACDFAGRPVMLLSDLADHTKNLKADPRAALLLDGTAGLAEPLTGARASLLGRIERVADAAERARLQGRYVARHPSAALYAGFGDFALYRFEIERAHLVAGFGRIHWIEEADALLYPGSADAAGLSAAESDVVQHMNEDHSDAVALYANRLLGLPGAGWRLTGIDPEGADLRRGGETARLPFDKPVRDAEAARVELVRLVKRARA